MRFLFLVIFHSLLELDRMQKIYLIEVEIKEVLRDFSRSEFSRSRLAVFATVKFSNGFSVFFGITQLPKISVGFGRYFDFFVYIICLMKICTGFDMVLNFILNNLFN
jgi:hypothetical protein